MSFEPATSTAPTHVEFLPSECFDQQRGFNADKTWVHNSMMTFKKNLNLKVQLTIWICGEKKGRQFCHFLHTKPWSFTFSCRVTVQSFWAIKWLSESNCLELLVGVEQLIWRCFSSGLTAHQKWRCCIQFEIMAKLSACILAQTHFLFCATYSFVFSSFHTNEVSVRRLVQQISLRLMVNF